MAGRILMIAAFAATFALLGCESDPSYTGTYKGPVFSTLTPTPPIFGSPSFDATITLTQNGSDITGTFSATTTYAGSTSTIEGTVSAIVGDGNSLSTFTLTITSFSPNCTPPQFTATGSGSLNVYTSTPSLVWNADGTSSCKDESGSYQSTKVELVTSGMAKQE
jgi:hypothetical protein